MELPGGRSIYSSPPAGLDRADIIDIFLNNPQVAEIFRRLPELGVAPCWIAGGAIVQSVWNHMTGRAPDYGIADYDLIYFDRTHDYAAEDWVIRRADALFQGSGITVEVKNQALVPFWYRRRFGCYYPAITSALESLHRYPTMPSSMAVTIRRGRPVLYAPFGLKDILAFRVRPNRRLPQRESYNRKTARWAAAWPELTIIPWD